MTEESAKYKNKVMLHSNGEMLWTETGMFETYCDVDPRAFPFDTQNCSLIVSGWMTTASYVNYTENGIILEEMQNTEWQLVSCEAISVQLHRDDYDLSKVNFQFTFKRRSEFYLLTVIVPFIVVSFLGLMTFPLPAESGEKVSLGMTCLLSFFVIQTSVSEHLPTSSHSMPFIGRYRYPYNFLCK